MISETLISQCDNTAGIVSEIVGNNAIPILAHVAPVVMPERGIAGVVAILQDITRQKAVEKMKSDFLAKVTHELKSPVATITQQLNTLLEGALGELSEEQKRMIEKAKQWSLGLISLISDLLTICKFESGITLEKKIQLDIKDVVLEAVDLLKPQADDKKITINLSMERLPKIYAGREDMKEVFANLIINAIKYNNEGGTIDICGEADDHAIRVSVSDNGFGIKQENLKLIFDRFFRVKNNTTRFITGTGLGLPIVKEIVESHNGSIEVRSEEGKGSRFTVSLPICPG